MTEIKTKSPIKLNNQIKPDFYTPKLPKNKEIFNLAVLNSQARHSDQFPQQKVILKYEGVNLGEIEMRNDSIAHYREIRFNMMKPKITFKQNYNDIVILYCRLKLVSKK